MDRNLGFTNTNITALLPPPQDTTTSLTQTSVKPSQTSEVVSRPLPSKSRVPRRPGQAPVIKLEALDDELGPLGPLGDNYTSPEPSPATTHDQPPKPPHKELTSRPRARQPYRGDGQLDTVALDDGDDDAGMRKIHGKVPPPVEVAPVPGTSRTGPLSVPVELAANPTFDIMVGDPHKVGDLTSAHIVYSVRTKVILMLASRRLQHLIVLCADYI